MGNPMAVVEHASKPIAGYREWDPRYPEVVARLVSELGAAPPGVTITHIGSTAVAGCGGKGVVDLLAAYPEGASEDTKSWLRGMGFGPQGAEFSRPWPESRPMYLGGYRCLDELFLVYVHVVALTSDEVRRFLEFRELLCGSRALVVEYCRLKREILSTGVTDTDEYATQKRAFFRSALGVGHALRKDKPR
jgi:GrpB-like predicted nucleotidyltransferase (UPF0157 family)